MRTMYLTAILLGLQLGTTAQQPATKPNIPIKQILSDAYHTTPAKCREVFFDRYSLMYLLDMKTGTQDVLTVRELKPGYVWGDTARRYGTVYRLSLELLHLEAAKMHIRLSITQYDGKTFNEKIPLGYFYDSRDIECLYDAAAKQWKYVKTLQVWDN